MATVTSVDEGKSCLTFVCDGEVDAEAHMRTSAFTQNCTRLNPSAEIVLPAPPPKVHPTGSKSIAKRRAHEVLDDVSDPLMHASLSICWPGDHCSYVAKVIERRETMGLLNKVKVEHLVEYNHNRDGQAENHCHWHDLREFKYVVLDNSSGSPSPPAPSAQGPDAAPRLEVPPAKQLKRTRKLRFVEWFAGSGRLSFALMRHGWDGVIHDFDKTAIEWEEHGVKQTDLNYLSDDFMSVERRSLGLYDYFHFSIDCSSFSGLSRGTNRRMPHNNFCGETTASTQGNLYLARTLDMINDQLDANPFFIFTVENPVGDMHKHPLIANRLELPRSGGGLGAIRCLLNFCKFSTVGSASAFHKPTYIWTNCGIHTGAQTLD